MTLIFDLDLTEMRLKVKFVGQEQTLTLLCSLLSENEVRGQDHQGHRSGDLLSDNKVSGMVKV